MAALLLAIIFSCAFGGALGSFVNVLIIRWHAGVSLRGRSACVHCRTPLSPRYLVPMFSWILLHGACATCGKKIHPQYPLVELAAVILTLVAVLRHNPLTAPWAFLFEVLISVGLMVPVVMDLRWQEIPVEYMAGVGLLAGLYQVLLRQMPIAPLFLSVVGASAFFALQRVVSRGRWLGAGDVWIGGAMGAVLATPVLTGIALYLAYVIGGFVACVGLFLGTFKRKSRLPFAPALAAGTMLTLWHGDTLLRWLERMYG